MKYEDFVELNNVTVQDCIDLYDMKGISVILNDGHVVDFVKEYRN